LSPATHRLAAFAVLTVVALATTLTSSAGDNFKTEEGYTSLFNGNDLTGWRYTAAPKANLEGKTETPDGRIKVENGVIVVMEKDSKGKGGIKDLFTVKDFNKDFILKMEFRAAPRADSGVYLRSSGAQLQVRDYPTVGPYKKLKNFKDGGWNELEIAVKGGAVTTVVNGKPVTSKDVLEVSVKDGKPTATLNGKSIDVNKIDISVGAVAECKCNGEILEKAFKVPSKGGIGVQAETGKFEFRRIRVKELP
jgi:hypothetical protein